jgi:hypothetical protein
MTDVRGASTLDNDFGSRLREKRAIIGVALLFTLLATVTIWTSDGAPSED